jgi:hypothetical protein
LFELVLGQGIRQIVVYSFNKWFALELRVKIVFCGVAWGGCENMDEF